MKPVQLHFLYIENCAQEIIWHPDLIPIWHWNTVPFAYCSDSKLSSVPQYWVLSTSASWRSSDRFLVPPDVRSLTPSSSLKTKSLDPKGHGDRGLSVATSERVRICRSWVKCILEESWFISWNIKRVICKSENVQACNLEASAEGVGQLCHYWGALEEDLLSFS